MARPFNDPADEDQDLPEEEYLPNMEEDEPTAAEDIRGDLTNSQKLDRVLDVIEGALNSGGASSKTAADDEAEQRLQSQDISGLELSHITQKDDNEKMSHAAAKEPPRSGHYQFICALSKRVYVYKFEINRGLELMPS